MEMAKKRKKKWIQKVNQNMKARGTKGSFTRY